MNEKNANTVEFAKELKLLDATMIVMGSMIGSGIFIAPSLMAGYMPIAQFLLLLWIIGGILTAFGAMAYGELATMMPKAGGQYIFLKKAYSPFWGFLYGWTLFFVIQTGFIAAVAIAFAKYLGILIPSLSEENIILSINIMNIHYTLSTAQIVGVAMISLLTFINCFGVALGALVQNIFTISKIAAIAALVLIAFLIGKGNPSNYFTHFSFTDFHPIRSDAISMGFLAAIAVAMSKALFAYDAWYSVTFTAEEVKEPNKTLPYSLIFGTIGVMLVYLLANMSYLYILPIDKMAIVQDNRVAAEVAKIILGNAGAILISIAILISTFGCNNGLILSGARVYYAMAKDGLFFKSASKIHPKYKTPAISLIIQGIWSIILTLSGTYNALLTYTAFASLLFNAMTVIGIFILRSKAPEMNRPYRCWGYPIIPLLYILVALFFIIYIIIGDPKSSAAGLLIISTGFFIYFAWKKKYNQQ